MNKLLLFIVVLLATLPGLGQACTNASVTGSVNVCNPAFHNKWISLNHASDLGSADQGCFLDQQVNWGAGNLTITMTKPGTSPTCGETGRTQASQPYLAGALVSASSFAPTSCLAGSTNCIPCTSGTCTIQAYIKVGKGWPAFWLLGGDGILSGSAGCEYQTIYSTFDNNGNCFWSQDTMPSGDSAETDIMEFVEPTYTDTNQNLFSNNATNNGSSQSISDASANFHLYTLHWAAGSLTFAVDGTASTTHWTSNVPVNPQFILLENRIQGPSGKVPGTFPQIMYVGYVQVCDGSTCSAGNGVAGGNNIFFDDFTQVAAVVGRTR